PIEGDGMSRVRWILVPAVALGAAFAATRLARRVRHGEGVHAPGGILVRDSGAYDAMSRRFFGGLFRSIGGDVAAAVPAGARVLEVGSGPGYLSIALARDHGLEVTGLDLDPAMIERATANAEQAELGATTPSFVVGNVASLPFPDDAFDLVVSTMSMHHWD